MRAVSHEYTDPGWGLRRSLGGWMPWPVVAPSPVPLPDDNNFQDPDAGAHPKRLAGGPSRFIGAEEGWALGLKTMQTGKPDQRAAFG